MEKKEICIYNNNKDNQADNDCCVDEMGSVIQRLVRVIQLFERDQIKIYGFTTSQCNTLLEIQKAGSLTMNELSERMKLNTSTMTRVLDNLVRDKYITRDRDETDRRIVVVTLTGQGKEAASRLSGSVKEYYKKIIENIPEGHVDEVLNSVNILQKAFEKANPNCC
jgi:MarR family transcriptional regulator, organic hydroperoxide resistance regulator